MIKMYLYTLYALVLCKSTESLIGLRPPSADPTYRKNQQIRQALHRQHNTKPEINQTQKDIAKFILQRSHKTFVLKKDVYDQLKTISTQPIQTRGQPINNYTSIYTLKESCNHYQALKCSIRFLKSTIRNDEDICHSFQDVADCLCPFCKTNECSVRQSLSTISADKGCHIVNKHQPSKGNTNCCEVELLKCTIDTYLSLNEKGASCETIGDFTTCATDFTGDLSKTEFDKIFQLLLSLTKACIYAINPYE